MNQAIAYGLEIIGAGLVLAWLWRYPDSFERMASALSGTLTANVRTLQGR